MPKHSRGFIRFDPFWWVNADTRAVEALAALVALTFAVVLLLPGDLFDLSGYRVMRALMPEAVWGGILLLQWALQSMAMCGNVRFLRFPSALFALLLWTLIGSCFWMVNPAALASYVFFWIAIFMGWVILRGPTDGDG